MKVKKCPQSPPYRIMRNSSFFESGKIWKPSTYWENCTEILKSKIDLLTEN